MLNQRHAQGTGGFVVPWLPRGHLEPTVAMSSSAFRIAQRAQTVRVGDDALSHLADELDAVGGQRAFVVSTRGRSAFADEVVAALGDRVVGAFDEARQHVPRATVDAARAAFDRAGADCVIAVGGGSAIGLGKALALESASPLPLVALPTTYAGSEATNIWGLRDGDHKTTGRDDRVAPRTILYLPRWTVGLPAALTAASGLNAMAHSVEALYAPDVNPMTRLLAIDSIRSLAGALRRLVVTATDLDARADAQWGAYLAGTALDRASLGLHHKLCHVLGGSFGLPHAETHAVLLPWAVAYNAPAAPDAMVAIADAIGAPSAPPGLHDLASELGIPPSLSAIGFDPADVDRAVEIALQRQYPNPRPIEAAPLAAMLRDAANGVAPGSYPSAD